MLKASSATSRTNGYRSFYKKRGPAATSGLSFCRLRREYFEQNEGKDLALKSDSGAAPSAFSFGAMQFGGKAGAAAAAEMYAAARGVGINFFDTAYGYTGGESERMLGQLVAAERADVLVATKVNYGAPSTPDVISASLDESLRRLDMDYVDLLYLHRFDPLTALDETFDGLAAAVDSGKARAIGVSNFSAWQTVKAQGLATARGVRIDAIQPMYNLVKRQAEVEILPMAADLGILPIPYSPLGGGLLTGKYTGGGGGRLTENQQYKARYGVDWMHKTAAGLVAIAAREGVHPATLAAAWAAGHPAVASPILSAKSAAQLAPSLAAVDYTLTENLRAEITALSIAPAPATDRLEEA